RERRAPCAGRLRVSASTPTKFFARRRLVLRQNERRLLCEIRNEQQKGMDMRTRLLGAATLLTVAFGVSAATAQVPGVTADTIKIGTFGALTGPGYLYGKLPMNGVEVVFDEINKAGGINGRKLELVREDDPCDPTAAIGAVKKLVDQDQ